MLLENSFYINDVRVLNEAEALVAAGYKVSVICPRSPLSAWHELLNGVHIYRYPQPPDGDSLFGYFLEYGYALTAIFLLSLLVLVREGFDIVHAHCPPDAFFLIGAFYKLLGKRYVYDHHDLSPEMYYYSRFRNGGNRLAYNMLMFFERQSCQIADCVIATNESYKAVEIERGGAPSERISIVRNGPDLDKLRLVEPDPDLRQKASTVLGYVGSIGPQDGLDYLLRALYHLIYDMDRRDVYCVIIGTGSDVPHLKTKAKEMNLEEYVWFTGWISHDDKIRYLSTADICTDPDPSNPFNDRCTMIKMMDYMALGKPIVAFDLPEHRVTAQDAAMYASPNDEFDFAKHIASLIDDPERCTRMGKIGRSRVESELAWAHQKMSLIEAYKKISSTSGII
jgi:glycosyltransferase involved in cell wall biosynthesis